MDISGVPIPAVPEVQTAPPRDAQLQTAVSEPTQGESAQNNPQADTGGSQSRRDESSNVGRHIDEHA
jgi:hypothetical protein